MFDKREESTSEAAVAVVSVSHKFDGVVDYTTKYFLGSLRLDLATPHQTTGADSSTSSISSSTATTATSTSSTTSSSSSSSKYESEKEPAREFEISFDFGPAS